MKTKQLKTIVLLVIVIIIWGLLIYRFIVSLNPDEDTSLIQNQLPRFKKNTEQVDQEEFEVFIPTRDPFLNIILVKPKPKPKTSKKTTLQNNINLEEIWSGISYKGVISKKNSNQFLYLINIKNNEVILKLNQAYEDYKLIKANKKSITLKHKAYQKTFSVLKTY